MNRNECLTYCKICGNRKFDKKKGIICGLSAEVVLFENYCSDFRINDDSRNLIIKQLEEKIYNKPNYFPLISDGEYAIKNLKNNKINFDNNIEIKESQKKKRPFLTYGILTILLTLLFILNIINNWDQNIVHFALILLPIGGTIYFFSTYFKNTSLLILDLVGVKIEDRVSFTWIEILAAHFEQVKDNDNSMFDEMNVVFHLSNNRKEKVNIKYAEGFSKEEIGELIFLYIKRLELLTTHNK